MTIVFVRIPIVLLLLLCLIFRPSAGVFIRYAEAAKRRNIHITDDLDDVVDDEEDEGWKQWGKKSTRSTEFDPPPSDLHKMEMSQIQAEMMKRQTGPVFGFVKLRLGMKRTPDMVGEIAMKWTKVTKTGGVEVKFTGFDLNTVMFTMERGQDANEVREFILEQEDAYEIKIGDQVFRRTGDPPLEELVEQIYRDKHSIKEDEHVKEEL